MISQLLLVSRARLLKDNTPSFYQHTGASVYTYDTSIWNMTWIHTGMGTTSRVVKAISAVIIIFWIYVIIIIIITTKHF
jgi:hypothetical protein